MIVCLLGLAIPMVRAAGPHFPLFFSPLAPRMDAEETAAALTRRLSRFQKRSPGTDARCEPHAQTSDWSAARDGAWDFICTYVDQPQSYRPARVKVGVRVGADAIVHVSSPHPLETHYVRQ